MALYSVTVNNYFQTSLSIFFDYTKWNKIKWSKINIMTLTVSSFLQVWLKEAGPAPKYDEEPDIGNAFSFRDWYVIMSSVLGQFCYDVKTGIVAQQDFTLSIVVGILVVLEHVYTRLIHSWLKILLNPHVSLKIKQACKAINLCSLHLSLSHTSRLSDTFFHA